METLCSDEDKALWSRSAAAEFEEDMNACAPGCLGGSRCTASCAQARQPQLTASCVSAYGELASCTASRCWSRCIGGASSACEACVDDKCNPRFFATTGLARKKAPNRGRARRTTADPDPAASSTAALSAALLLVLLLLLLGWLTWRRRRGRAPAYDDPLVARAMGRKARASDQFVLPPPYDDGRAASLPPRDSLSSRSRYLSFEAVL